jgi:hypothetical protein
MIDDLLDADVPRVEQLADWEDARPRGVLHLGSGVAGEFELRDARGILLARADLNVR